MTVDRSYSEYEAIRNYQDRGMMKWGAFATGELTDAQQTEKSENLKKPIKQTQTQDEILQALIASWTDRKTVTLNVIRNKEVEKIVGQVMDVIDKESFRFDDGLKQVKIKFLQVFKVEIKEFK